MHAADTAPSPQLLRQRMLVMLITPASRMLASISDAAAGRRIDNGGQTRVFNS